MLYNSHIDDLISYTKFNKNIRYLIHVCLISDIIDEIVYYDA